MEDERDKEEGRKFSSSQKITAIFVIIALVSFFPTGAKFEWFYIVSWLFVACIACFFILAIQPLFVSSERAGKNWFVASAKYSGAKLAKREVDSQASKKSGIDDQH